MKLRTFHVLCYLCLLYAFVQSKKIGRGNQPVPNPLAPPTSQEHGDLEDANNPRDKRALGLILSGLAQVFGYTVNPVQIASLPNPSPESDEARSIQPMMNTGQMNSTKQNSSSTTMAPGQRETIRFTGVVNFGNGTDVLTQLQQYERLFHGSNDSSSTTTQPPPPSSTQSPQFDPRTTSNQPIPPLLVKIPLPTVSESPLPAMPQPPLPEIPPQDINLTYPEPFIPVRMQQQTVYRMNMSTEKVTMENKPIFDGKDVHSPSPPTMFLPQTEEPHWKQEHEIRLTELERKQEEQAQRLREQEFYRNRQKDSDHSGEDEREYSGKEKQIGHGGQGSGCRKEHEEEDQSRERYESGEKIREYPTTQRTMEQENSGEDDGRYQDYKNDDVYREDAPQVSENYTSIQYSEPLPLSEDDEQRRPEELRNSYGELLYNQQLFDDGFANFFDKLKQPLSDIYSSSRPQVSKEETSKEEEDSRDNQKDEDRSDEKSREEEDLPARNRYEEYNLEEETDTRRKDGKEPVGDSPEPPIKYSNEVPSNVENRSDLEEHRSSEELDFNKYMPLVVPVRYLTAPEELEKAKSRLSMTDKSRKDNNVLNAEATSKLTSKESKRPKKENLKPVIGLPERQMPKKLHEGEQKELQIWPPPFDFVLDSTIHANVVPSPDNVNAKVSNTRRKSKSIGKIKEGRHDRGRGPVIDSTQRPYNYPEGFKNNLEYGAVPREQLMLNEPLNAVKNRTRSENESARSDQKDPRKAANFLDRYKYTANNNNYGNPRQSIEIQHSSEQRIPSTLHSKKFESLKRSIEKSEPNTGNKKQVNDKTRITQDAQVIRQMSEPTPFSDPRQNYNFFDFGGNAYGYDYGRGNERLPGIFEGDKKIGDEGTIGFAMPQQNVYRYDESLTKFANEPESKGVKVGDYANGAAAAMRMVEQEQIGSNGPITYVDYTHIL
ncbi:hypothetical protein WN48_01959 [Eufriesea mexicana]|uniref:Uncharacterized protein n=1 Tax=Eufriesea mexicana TaxID=516756 RepID=A0A310SG69_9HYME|nr:PREDICTED: uncharacterized protein LOC108548257 [Eufriesea mexicana]OAD57458.1 hypothetical protein WN48_01959 [Eufriesea mexicana]